MINLFSHFQLLYKIFRDMKQQIGIKRNFFLLLIKDIFALNWFLIEFSFFPPCHVFIWVPEPYEGSDAKAWYPHSNPCNMDHHAWQKNQVQMIDTTTDNLCCGGLSHKTIRCQIIPLLISFAAYKFFVQAVATKTFLTYNLNQKIMERQTREWIIRLKKY